ncbi:MAG: MucR family transcriptional regulator [Syntrophobacteraceae bacterium]
MTKKLIEIASEIVQTQVSLTPMSATDISLSLRQVFSTLQELQKAEMAGADLELTQTASETAVEEQAAPKLAPENSIQNDKVICLECGAEMKQLTQKHLVAHGISPKEYKKKYGFPMKTPLAAKSLTKARSKAAKKRGLPENLRKAIEAKRQSKAAATATPESSGPGDTASKRGGKRGGQTRLKKKS